MGIQGKKKTPAIMIMKINSTLTVAAAGRSDDYNHYVTGLRLKYTLDSFHDSQFEEEDFRSPNFVLTVTVDFDVIT